MELRLMALRVRGESSTSLGREAVWAVSAEPGSSATRQCLLPGNGLGIKGIWGGGLGV